jgi:hypothetical protein
MNVYVLLVAVAIYMLYIIMYYCDANVRSITFQIPTARVKSHWVIPRKSSRKEPRSWVGPW